MTPATLDVVEPRHPILQRLYCYWQERRGVRAFPARRDVDPLDFSYALGHVALIDVAHEPLRFRFRLVPSTIAHYLGYEATGKYVDAIPEPELRACLIESYAQVVHERRPLFSTAERILDGRRWRFEVAHLPLSGDGTTIDMLMVCRIADPPRRTTAASSAVRVDSVFVRS